MSEAAATAAGVPPLHAPVRAVLFDYGLTLVTFRRPTAELRVAYAEIHRLLRARRRGRTPVPDVDALLMGVHDQVEAAAVRHEQAGELRELSLDRLTADAYRTLGLRLDRATLRTVQLIEQRAWFGGIHLPPLVRPALDSLRWRGIRLGLCSNAPWLAEGMLLQLEHLGLRGHLDSVTLSSTVGWRKPGPRIFRRALRDLGARPATTLMVGDRSREDVDGAHGVGMRAVRLRAHHDDAAAPERADFVADSLADVVALVDACNGGAHVGPGR